MASAPVSPVLRKRVLKVVVISLLLDLISFTFILPLFPRLLKFYLSLEQFTTKLGSPTLLSRIITTLNAYKTSFNLPITPEYDTILLGGALGSLYSLCQALAAPVLGRISDTYGRRPALLLSMCGNILSVLLWLVATDFRTFLLSRVVGGLSEGNVQLAFAMATDVSNEKERSKTMGLVGGCFAVAFTVGPALGAWLGGREWVKQNPFGVAAGFSLVLIVVETIYLYFYLPETHPLLIAKSAVKSSSPSATATEKPDTDPTTLPSSPPRKGQKKKITHINTPLSLSLTHLTFIALFSGLEFSLPFLTSTLFSYTPALNGRLLGFIGLLSSLLHGILPRRLYAITSIRLGVLSCLFALIVLAQKDVTETALYSAAGALAITSASVVGGLNTLAGFEAGEGERGKVLGGVRSAGQVGRALGPVVFCSLYWGLGRERAFWCAVWAMVPVVGWVLGGLRNPEGKGEKVGLGDGGRQKKEL